MEECYDKTIEDYWHKYYSFKAKIICLRQSLKQCIKENRLEKCKNKILSRYSVIIYNHCCWNSGKHTTTQAYLFIEPRKGYANYY